MALFQFKCDKCNRGEDKLQDSPTDYKCECGGTMKRQWTSFKINVSFRDGYDDGLGKYFNTQRERDYYVDANNFRRITD